MGKLVTTLLYSSLLKGYIVSMTFNESYTGNLNPCIVKSNPSQESKKKSGVLLRETKMLTGCNFQGKKIIYTKLKVLG